MDLEHKITELSNKIKYLEKQLAGKRPEPVPTFKKGDSVFLHKEKPVRILLIRTYCLTCDEFFSEPKYLVATASTMRPILVKESELSFEEEL